MPSSRKGRVVVVVVRLWGVLLLLLLLVGSACYSAAANEKTCDCRLVLAFGDSCGEGYGPCNPESHYCTSGKGFCQRLSSCTVDSDCRNPDNQSWLDDGNSKQCPSDTEPVCFDDRTCGCGIPCEPCPTPTTTPPSPETIPCASTEDCPRLLQYCSFENGCLPVGTCGKNRDCRHPDNAFANDRWKESYYCNRTAGVELLPGLCLYENGTLPVIPLDSPVVTNDQRSDTPRDGGRKTGIAVVVALVVLLTGWW